MDGIPSVVSGWFSEMSPMWPDECHWLVSAAFWWTFMQNFGFWLPFFDFDIYRMLIVTHYES
ncbi:hypothetical protein DsansV1_C27g0204291 [Dioscorea sansibarensis]